MKSMHELKKLLCEELEEYAEKGELSAGSLDVIQKLTDTIKNIDKIEMLEEDDGYSERRGYSRDGEWMARGGYGRGMSYEGGSSNAGGSSYGGSSYNDGSSYARRRRDSRGRYSSDSGRGGYSRDDGKEKMMDELEELMGSAENEKQREVIRHCMTELEKA